MKLILVNIPNFELELNFKIEKKILEIGISEYSIINS